jgi:hypothetical protein
MFRSDAGIAPVNLLSLRSRYVRFVRLLKLAGMLDAILFMCRSKLVRLDRAPAPTK